MRHRFSAARGLLIGAAALAVGLGSFAAFRIVNSGAREGTSGRGATRPPLRGEVQLALLQADSRKPDFDGIIHGWRIAPGPTLEADGTGSASRSFDCTPDEAAGDRPTTLDFTLTYSPPGAGSPSDPERIVCDGTARSVAVSYPVRTSFGESVVRIDRSTWDRRAFPIEAASDRVGAGVVGGKPAVFVRPIDAASGFGPSEILIIEDDELDPFATILHLATSDLPFEQLLEIAEGVR
ncbi:MAG: hypothetical protein HY775_01255 [Acidobacteria bacterium]|nr:hypothetical protein [Acidobacteriota bacterium]